MWLIYFCFGINIASMAPLIAPISEELGVGFSSMGLILGAWPLTYIIASIPSGILLDRFGARRMLFVSALIMAASMIARSAAVNSFQMFFAVSILGFGGPLISVGAPKVIAGCFKGPSRASAMGVYVTGPYLGGLVSLSLMNSVVMVFVDQNWRAAICIFALFTLMSGMLWLIATNIKGVKVAEDADGKKFNLLAFFELIGLRPVQLILLMSVGIFFINHSLNNWLPEILVSRGLDRVAAGYWASIPSIIGILGALIIPRLAVPKYRLSVMAGLFIATFTASLLLQTDAGLLMFMGLCIQGLARGSMMTVAILILMETPKVPADRLGLAGGLFFTVAEIGGVLGPVSFGILSDLTGSFAPSLALVTTISATLIVVLIALHHVTPKQYQ
ncbi:MFS transporter [Roseobacter sp. HKCC-CH-9208]|uniref:MFS transporter n=1 Tax=Roseobacter sp. HKCC-CH-9208 TaxID=3120339 RepID=UPI0030EEE813